jgi:hypothetical protein
MKNAKSSGDLARTVKLIELFGESSNVAEAVLGVLDAEPWRNWQPQDLVVATQCELVDVMVVLARLTVSGFIQHDGLGSCYRAEQRLRRAV